MASGRLITQFLFIHYQFRYQAEKLFGSLDGKTLALSQSFEGPRQADLGLLPVCQFIALVLPDLYFKRQGSDLYFFGVR